MTDLAPHAHPRTNRAIGPVIDAEEAEAFRQHIAFIERERGHALPAHPHLREALEELKAALAAWERKAPA